MAAVDRGAAAGDVARYPDPIGGKLARVEHWVHAERQGQAAARNMLGLGKPFTDAPFFWSQHYDVALADIIDVVFLARPAELSTIYDLIAEFTRDFLARAGR